MDTGRRAIVECLLSANYSEAEIIDYLKGPFGLTEDEAFDAVRDAVGSGPARPTESTGNHEMNSSTPTGIERSHAGKNARL